jgi:hypothetical protein
MKGLRDSIYGPRAGGFTLVAALQASATTPHPIAARDSADCAYRVCPRG